MELAAKDGVLWDAVVVGAGPAGCAAAYDLAAAGHAVLLVDKAEFPRGKACAGGLTTKAVRALRYSIEPVVRRWERSITLEEGPGRAVRVGRRSPVCAMTVRAELDSFCLERTRARGAHFRRVPALEALEGEPDRVTLRFAGGERVQARFVVGADGVHSSVRALAGPASWFRKGFALEADVPYTEGGEEYGLCFDFAPMSRGYGWLFPRDNHVNVGLYAESAEGALPDRGALDQYIAARCGGDRAYSRPVGQFLGFGAANYHPGAKTRVLLGGDAAGFVDPLTGEGIYGAIRSGQAAAAAIGAALRSSSASLALTYSQAARSLQADLRVAEHAAARFYARPARGFELLRMPILPRAVLHAYAEGISLSGLLRGVRIASRLLSR